MFRAGHVVLAEQRLFIQAQIARDGAHESVAEDSAGQLRPIFIFQRFHKTLADACGLGEFVHGNFAQFALALQAFTKISPGHEPEPVLDNPSATAKRSFTGATAREKRLGIPERTIGGAIRWCQTEAMNAGHVGAGLSPPATLHCHSERSRPTFSPASAPAKASASAERNLTSLSIPPDSALHRCFQSQSNIPRCAITSRRALSSHLP